MASLNVNEEYTKASNFTYHSHCTKFASLDVRAVNPGLIAVHIPLSKLCVKLSNTQMMEASKVHGMLLDHKTHTDVHRQALQNHNCVACDHVVTLFRSSRCFATSIEIGQTKNLLNRTRPQQYYPDSTAYRRQ